MVVAPAEAVALTRRQGPTPRLGECSWGRAWGLGELDPPYGTPGPVAGQSHRAPDPGPRMPPHGGCSPEPLRGTHSGGVPLSFKFEVHFSPLPCPPKPGQRRPLLFS